METKLVGGGISTSGQGTESERGRETQTEILWKIMQHIRGTGQ